VHVADAYDAMTSDRPYRRGMSDEQAVRVLQQHAGTQFDPAVVPVLAGIIASAPEGVPGAGTAAARMVLLPRVVNDSATS